VVGPIPRHLTAKPDPSWIRWSKQNRPSHWLYDHKTDDRPFGHDCATGQSYRRLTGPIRGQLVGRRNKHGVVPGRFGNRKPQMYRTAAFFGWPVLMGKTGSVVAAILGMAGFQTFPDQAKQPTLNQTKMNNSQVGTVRAPFKEGFRSFSLRSQEPALDSSLLRCAVRDAFAKSQQQYDILRVATAAYESSGEVQGFSSKQYDASNLGRASENCIATGAEESGRQLYFRHSHKPFNATTPRSYGCTNHNAGERHVHPVLALRIFGVTRTSGEPLYQETRSGQSPHGFNPQGDYFIDFGGSQPQSGNDGTRFSNKVTGGTSSSSVDFQNPPSTSQRGQKRPSQVS